MSRDVTEPDYIYYKKLVTNDTFKSCLNCGKFLVPPHQTSFGFCYGAYCLPLAKEAEEFKRLSFLEKTYSKFEETQDKLEKLGWKTKRCDELSPNCKICGVSNCQSIDCIDVKRRTIEFLALPEDKRHPEVHEAIVAESNRLKAARDPKSTVHIPEPFVANKYCRVCSGVLGNTDSVRTGYCDGTSSHRASSKCVEARDKALAELENYSYTDEEEFLEEHSTCLECGDELGLPSSIRSGYCDGKEVCQVLKHEKLEYLDLPEEEKTPERKALLEAELDYVHKRFTNKAKDEKKQLSDRMESLPEFEVCVLCSQQLLTYGDRKAGFCRGNSACTSANKRMQEEIGNLERTSGNIATLRGEFVEKLGSIVQKELTNGEAEFELQKKKAPECMVFHENIADGLLPKQPSCRKCGGELHDPITIRSGYCRTEVEGNKETCVRNPEINARSAHKKLAIENLKNKAYTSCIRCNSPLNSIDEQLTGFCINNKTCVEYRVIVRNALKKGIDYNGWHPHVQKYLENAARHNLSAETPSNKSNQDAITRDFITEGEEDLKVLHEPNPDWEGNLAKAKEDRAKLKATWTVESQEDFNARREAAFTGKVIEALPREELEKRAVEQNILSGDIMYKIDTGEDVNESVPEHTIISPKRETVYMVLGEDGMTVNCVDEEKYLELKQKEEKKMSATNHPIVTAAAQAVKEGAKTAVLREASDVGLNLLKQVTANVPQVQMFLNTPVGANLGKALVGVMLQSLSTQTKMLGAHSSEIEKLSGQVIAMATTDLLQPVIHELTSQVGTFAKLAQNLNAAHLDEHTYTAEAVDSQ